MHMEVRALFGRFVWRGINIYVRHNPSFPRFEDQSHTEGVQTQPGRTRFTMPYAYDSGPTSLGHQGIAKSFLKGAQIFQTMSNSSQLCPTDFPGGAKGLQ